MRWLYRKPNEITEHDKMTLIILKTFYKSVEGFYIINYIILNLQDVVLHVTGTFLLYVVRSGEFHLHYTQLEDAFHQS